MNIYLNHQSLLYTATKKRILIFYSVILFENNYSFQNYLLSIKQCHPNWNLPFYALVKTNFNYIKCLQQIPASPHTDFASQFPDKDHSYVTEPGHADRAHGGTGVRGVSQAVHQLSPRGGRPRRWPADPPGRQQRPRQPRGTQRQGRVQRWVETIVVQPCCVST